MVAEINNENHVLYPPHNEVFIKKYKIIHKMMEPFVKIVDIQDVNPLNEVIIFKQY